jgi:DNA-binding MarR family transcriptional regulator
MNSAAIHLLRRLRREDPASGLSPARLSAMSVIVFGGTVTMGELAEAEQVQLPTISRLVSALEHDGLVTREADPADARVVRVKPTPEGIRICYQGRERRVRYLAEQLRCLPPEELATLGEAAGILERLLDQRPCE